ncbi:hypothetical protein M5X66_10515 [Providencia sp. PROV188]|uniref:Uncharacterized protein n=1 Tax=Providencia alcalifaciens TaxID=126385 RepID=A0A4R3NPL7_9GAMM|nr:MULTISPECIES: hypothetical protein [Providencia]ETS99883.1 hypothetical protein HMPREF1568_0227 [Providencia alcalifaciens PAL-3]EUD00830.1 hypothetical protein HMPREF1566_2816 [Providencia alcalifaciens PAL-1]MTC40801.1 hypothetical protein [Providencia sp. wls1921]TCT36728.1 hypothetical protein EC835_102179 [Providencia alcalifaciens]WBM59441.1 hypothetical protein M5X66_10515 [Providencia sp. PROV188]
MSWKSIVAVIGLIIYMITFLGSGFYLLTDNTCSIDKASLEKCCQSAINYHKGKQVIYEIR